MFNGRAGIARAGRLGLMSALLIAWVGLASLPVRADEATKDTGKNAPEAYHLEAGDEVAITVSPQKGFDAKGTILPDGVLRLASVGKIIAQGMTLDELEAYCKKILSVDLKNPDVTATLEKLHPPKPPIDKKPPVVTVGTVTITGAVEKPGPLELVEGLRLQKAIDNAGGAKQGANLEEIVIFHRNMTKTIVDLSKDENILSADHNLVLQDGDSVNIRYIPQEKQTVQIRGQVVNPIQQEYKPNMSLDDLIVFAGKLTPLADVEHVQIKHKDKDQVEMVNLVERQDQGITGRVTLQPGDEIYIPKVKDTVTVIGAVARGGPRPIKPGETVREFFTTSTDEIAGGGNPLFVDANNAELIRPGETERRKLPLRDILRKKDHPANIALQPGDLIYLPAKQEKSGGLLRTLTAVSPLTSLFSVFGAF
jgi:protein involved in polysaccharide export with SLBB domain